MIAENYLPRIAIATMLFFSLVFANDKHQVEISGKRSTLMREFNPKVIVDAGAYEGSYFADVRKIYPSAYVFMIEANPEKKQKLTTAAILSGNAKAAVGNPVCEADGRMVPFYKMETGSSFLPENTPWVHQARMEMLQCKTIDTLLKEHDVPTVDILKLDLQGAELHALMGATEALKKTTFVVLELANVYYNVGGVCYFELDEYLRNAGFVLHDVTEVFKNILKPGTPGMIQFGVTYVNPDKLPHGSFRPHTKNADHFCKNRIFPSPQATTSSSNNNAQVTKPATVADVVKPADLHNIAVEKAKANLLDARLVGEEKASDCFNGWFNILFGVVNVFYFLFGFYVGSYKKSLRRT